MMDEEYQALVGAITLLDAVDATLENSGDAQIDDWLDALGAIRNQMNKRRRRLLGKGDARPFFVSELAIPSSLEDV